MEKKKKRLEEENEEIETEVTRLKKYIAEQQRDLVSQKHTNFELLNQLTECVNVNNRNIMVLEEIWKKVEDYTNILEDHFDDLKRHERQQHSILPHDSGGQIETDTTDSMDDGGTTDSMDDDKGTSGDHTESPYVSLAKRRPTGMFSTEDTMAFVLNTGCFIILFILAAIYLMIPV